ncbi:MAG: hypothetical protein PHT41_04235 [Candidatus Omnitrophica bacterium]|nr:hypothetical protein [Candidatus Omnitrophota bacterium]MDD5237540.1 hypothetical protein [Candidatus Omnitrophota bacterium]
MKKAVLLAMAFCFISSLAFAQIAISTPVVENALTIKGDIIDNMCATAHKDDLADFVKTHTKECALAPACVDSGYSIFSDGKLYKFDKDSSAKVAEFLKKEDSKLKVTVTAKMAGEELSLISIENQKE